MVKYTMDILSIPNYYIKKGDPTGTVTGRSQGIAHTTSRICSRRNATRRTTWLSKTGSLAMKKFRKNMLEAGLDEEMCREMDKLADEDHTYHLNSDECRVYLNNGWIRSNTVGSDTMPVWHRTDFKQALSALRQLKNQEDSSLAKMAKFFLILVELARIMVDTLFLRKSPRRCIHY